YSDEQKPVAFPPGALPHPTLPPEERLSWLVALLPYMEREDLYHSIDRTKGWQDEANAEAVGTVIPQFTTPSHPVPPAPGSPAPTHFVGIAGVGTDAAFLPAGHPRAGIFGYDRRTTLAEMKDGLSTTMLAAETHWENGPWAAGGPSTVRGF